MLSHFFSMSLVTTVNASVTGAAGEPACLYSARILRFSVGPTKRSTRDTSPVILVAIPMILVSLSDDLANVDSTNHAQALGKLYGSK